MLIYVHLCICVSWSHLGWSSLLAGLCLCISFPTVKSAIAAHFSFLCVILMRCCCVPSWSPDLAFCPLLLAASGHRQEMHRVGSGVLCSTTHWPLTFLTKRREAHWFLQTSDVFSGKTEAAVRVLWEIQYRPDVLFKSLTKDRDIPVINQNEQLLSKDQIVLSINPQRGKAEKLRLMRDCKCEDCSTGLCLTPLLLAIEAFMQWPLVGGKMEALPLHSASSSRLYIPRLVRA